MFDEVVAAFVVRTAGDDKGLEPPTRGL